MAAFFAVDFAFYWIHRAGHGKELPKQDLEKVFTFPFSEVNFLWAIHQMHHSSEHFNLTTSLRYV